MLNHSLFKISRRNIRVHQFVYNVHCIMYAHCMTSTMSFRAEDDLVKALESEAARTGVTKSDLLVRAAKEMLYRLACERDAAIYDELPITADEQATWPQTQWPTDSPGTDWSEIFAS